MKKPKKENFECTVEQIALLKQSIAKYHRQNQLLESAPLRLTYAHYQDFFKRIEKSKEEVQAAFWACTAGYNSLSHCQLLKDIKTFENFVAQYEEAT